MTIATTHEHAPATSYGAVSLGYARKRTRSVGAGNGAAAGWPAMPSFPRAHVAFAGAN